MAATISEASSSTTAAGIAQETAALVAAAAAPAPLDLRDPAQFARAAAHGDPALPPKHWINVLCDDKRAKWVIKFSTSSKKSAMKDVLFTICPDAQSDYAVDFKTDDGTTLYPQLHGIGHEEYTKDEKEREKKKMLPPHERRLKYSLDIRDLPLTPDQLKADPQSPARRQLFQKLLHAAYFTLGNLLWADEKFKQAEKQKFITAQHALETPVADPVAAAKQAFITSATYGFKQGAAVVDAQQRPLRNPNGTIQRVLTPKNCPTLTIADDAWTTDYDKSRTPPSAEALRSGDPVKIRESMGMHRVPVPVYMLVADRSEGAPPGATKLERVDTKPLASHPHVPAYNVQRIHCGARVNAHVVLTGYSLDHGRFGYGFKFRKTTMTSPSHGVQLLERGDPNASMPVEADDSGLQQVYDVEDVGTIYVPTAADANANAGLPTGALAPQSSSSSATAQLPPPPANASFFVKAEELQQPQPQKPAAPQQQPAVVEEDEDAQLQRLLARKREREAATAGNGTASPLKRAHSELPPPAAHPFAQSGSEDDSDAPSTPQQQQQHVAAAATATAAMTE